MTTDRSAIFAVVAGGILLAGCAETSMFERPGDSTFGEANRQTMMAQVIDPDPVYDTDATASGEVGAAAVQRYRQDKVKQPDSIRTTNVGSEGEGSSGSGPQ